MTRRETIRTTEYVYTAIFEPAPEGGYVVTVPALPGVVTEGDTLDEARIMVADAIKGYLEVLREDGLPIPIEEPQGTIREAVRIKLKTA
jgi:antitoxin HicB